MRYTVTGRTLEEVEKRVKDTFSRPRKVRVVSKPRMITGPNSARNKWVAVLEMEDWLYG